MKPKVIAAVVLTVVALLAGGVTLMNIRAAIQADEQSLAAQRAALPGGGRGPGGGGPGGPGGGPGGMMADLNLTADQQSQMEALQKEMRAQMQANPPSAGGGPPSGMDKMRERMDAILTPEQRAKMQERMPPMGGGPGGGPMGGGPMGAPGSAP
jgi:Spy/CpxP family protein refolding chaperone